MVGNKVFLSAIFFLTVVCCSSCNASDSWDKYSFDPAWKLFGRRGAVKINSDLEVVPTRSRHGGSPIDSILIRIPQGVVKDSLPDSLVLFAQDSWHSKKSFEFYLKGIYLYAKKNPGYVSCGLGGLCKVDYSLIPLKDRGKADSYFDYMLAISADSHSYVSKKFLDGDQWGPDLLVDTFFAECRDDSGCFRKGMFRGYFFEYRLQPPENNWHVIDNKLRKFLADNVRAE